MTPQSSFLEVLANGTHCLGGKSVLLFFFFNSRGPRKQARSGPETLDVHIAKSEPAGSQRREASLSPKPSLWGGLRPQKEKR